MRLPGHDREEPVHVDVAHLLGVLHLTDHLLELALARTVAQGSNDGSYLEREGRKISIRFRTNLSHVNCFVVLVVKYFKSLHNLVVNLSRQDLTALSQ